MIEDTSRGFRYVLHTNTVLEKMVLLAFEEYLPSDGDGTAAVDDTEEEGDERFAVTKDEAEVEEG